MKQSNSFKNKKSDRKGTIERNSKRAQACQYTHKWSNWGRTLTEDEYR